jgi:hypothetical protein
MTKLSISSQISDKFTNEQKEIISTAIDYITKAVNHNDFKEKIISFKDNEANVAFLMNEDMSNERIYSYIMSGSDKFDPTKDYDLDIEILPFKSEDIKNDGGSTLGYVRGNKKPIYLNTDFMLSNAPVIIAGVIIHEYMHNLDFGHDSGIGPFKKRIDNYEYTVPYAIGFIITDIINVLYKDVPGYIYATPDDIKNSYSQTFDNFAADFVNGL